MVFDKIYTSKRHVNCDGGGGAGHPKIYLEIDNRDHVVCPYCSRMFVYSKNNTG